MFNKEDKVVCIDDTKQLYNVLKKGNIYTVRGMSGGSGVLLREIFLPKYPEPFEFIEMGHKMERFRLADETDIFLDNLRTEAFDEIEKGTLTLENHE